MGDLGAKYGDLGEENLCLGSLDAMGCLRVWVGWDFGAESGGFGVFLGGTCVRTAAVRGTETARPNSGKQDGFGVTWRIWGQNMGILGTKRMSLGSVGILGSSGVWDASGFAV